LDQNDIMCQYLIDSCFGLMRFFASLYSQRHFLLITFFRITNCFISIRINSIYHKSNKI